MDAYQQVIDTLSRFKRVLITTHVRPDGDAIGSTAAFALALKQKNIDFTILLLSHLPRKYAFVYEDAGLTHVEAEARTEDLGLRTESKADASLTQSSVLSPQHFATSSFVPHPSSWDAYDALVVLDTGTWSQLPGLQALFENWPKPRIVIDHHLTQQSWAEVKLVDTAAGAAGEIVADLLMRWGVSFTPEIAQALFVAIVSDTGWFMFSSTRPQTLRLAARLMEAGVDTDRIYQLLYQNERPERVLLQTRALASLELLSDGKLAVMTIRKSDFTELNAHVNDTENLINIPLQIRSVEVCVLFVEPPQEKKARIEDGGSRMEKTAPSSILHPPSSSSLVPQPIRVSFRSKGQIDVAKLAEQFQGGGHARASGAKFQTTLEEARHQVLTALVKP